MVKVGCSSTLKLARPKGRVLGWLRRGPISFGLPSLTLIDAALFGLGVEGPGGGQVLDDVAQGFIDGDLFRVAPAFDFAG